VTYGCKGLHCELSHLESVTTCISGGGSPIVRLVSLSPRERGPLRLEPMLRRWVGKKGPRISPRTSLSQSSRCGAQRVGASQALILVKLGESATDERAFALC
jgi:hypothetical protein